MTPSPMVKNIMFLCEACDETMEKSLESKFLESLCQCDHYNRWICPKCAEEEKEFYQNYSKYHTLVDYSWNSSNPLDLNPFTYSKNDLFKGTTNPQMYALMSGRGLVSPIATSSVTSVSRGKSAPEKGRATTYKRTAEHSFTKAMPHYIYRRAVSLPCPFFASCPRGRAPLSPSVAANVMFSSPTNAVLLFVLRERGP